MEGEGNGVDLWAVGCRVLAAAMFGHRGERKSAERGKTWCVAGLLWSAG
jgi:hypothetical protein